MPAGNDDVIAKNGDNPVSRRECGERHSNTVREVARLEEQSREMIQAAANRSTIAAVVANLVVAILLSWLLVIVYQVSGVAQVNATRIESMDRSMQRLDAQIEKFHEKVVSGGKER